MNNPFGRPVPAALPNEHIIYVDADDDPDISDPAKTWICQTCELPLNRLYTDADGFAWVHIREYNGHDHQPVPTHIYRDARRKTDCDFCSDHVICNWTYEGNHLHGSTLVDNTVRDYGNRFAACDACADIIDRDVIPHRDYTRLLRRAHNNPEMRKRHGIDPVADAIAEREMLRMWNKFFRDGAIRLNVGPPTRLDPRRVDKYRRGLHKFWNHPGLYERLAGHGLKPHAVPGFCVGDEYTEHLIAQGQPGNPIAKPAFNKLQHHITTGLDAAAGTDGGQYWISDRFTDLATIAGTEFDTITITREQLPAAHGFAVYAHPIGHIDRPEGRAGIRAFSWTLIPGGIWINIYFQTEDADPYADTTNARAEYGELMSPSTGAAFSFNTDLTLPEDAHVIRVMFATWFFLTQPGVAEQQPAPTNKREARAYQRTHGHKMPDVILVDLRRRPRRTTTNTTTAGPRGPLEYIRYTRGHWKHQPYGPKRGQRKLIYVSRYISGPEDAPLRPTTPTVRVLR